MGYSARNRGSAPISWYVAEGRDQLRRKVPDLLLTFEFKAPLVVVETSSW
jgi:hypothetical protein